MQKRHYLSICMRAFFCAGLLLVVSWLPLAPGAPLASAHTFVIGSDPIDGSTINKPPAGVRIYFDAPISPLSQASVSVYVPGSANPQMVSTNHGTLNATNPKELDIALLPAAQLPQGGYEVKWTALSLTDGHTSWGLIGFNLGYSNTGVSGTPVLGPSTSNHFPQLTLPGGLSIAWDWLVTFALLFWAGILVSESLIIPRVLSPGLLSQARKHSRPLQALCLAGLLVGEGINLILRATTFSQAPGVSASVPETLLQFVLSTNYGHFWLARVVLLGAVLALFWSAKRQPAPVSAVSGASGQGSKRFHQLRQQARPESGAENSGASLPPRSPARVSGAVAANLSSLRSSTSSHPRLAAQDILAETPAGQPSPWLSGGLLGLAALVMLSLILSNDLLQLTPLPLSAAFLSGLSLAAQATWFGCLAYLGFLLFPLQPATNPDQHADLLIRVLKRARPFLLAAISVLLVSELFLNEATISTPLRFLDHPYGRVLLVRDVVLVVMLCVTGFMLFVLLPRLQRQAVLLPVVTAEMPARRARTFKLEKTEHAIKRALHALSGLAALTLICLALMNFFAPPVVFPNLDYSSLVKQYNAGANPASPPSQARSIDGLSLVLSVSPARVGTANTVSLTINNARGQVVSNATIRLVINMQVMDMGTTRATINGGNTTYSATFQANQAFTMAGLWIIQAAIDQPGQKTVVATFQVMAE